MKLRIILGTNLSLQYQNAYGLENIYVSPKCIIQGDSDVHVVKESGLVRAVIVGKVLGKRNGNVLEKIDEKHHDVKKLLCSGTVDTCMKKLEGRFVVVRLNKGDSYEIFCDRFGQFDCYYEKKEDGVIFSTGLDMLPFKDSNVEYDQIALAHSLYVYGFRPPKRHTLYKNVKRLGVGEYAHWNDGQLIFNEIPPIIVPTAKEYSEKDLKYYSEILLDAVEKRSSSSGNIVYLSSGWDSTAILACLTKIHGPEKVRAVIGRMHYANRSGVINPFEIERSQSVADYYKVKLDITEFDFVKRGPQILERLQPLLISQMLGGMSVFIFAELAEHVVRTYKDGEAIFSGEISDGAHAFGFSQFASILEHHDLGFREYGDKMSQYLFGPSFFNLIQKGEYEKDIVYQLFQKRMGDVIFEDPANGKKGKIRQLMSNMFLRDKRFPFWSLDNTKILTAAGKQCYASEMETYYIDRPATEATSETLYFWYIHLYNSFHWQGGTVSCLAKTLNEYSLDISLPFYDSRLHEVLAGVPESCGRGLDLNPTKHPLKWMLKNIIDYPLHLQVGPHSYLYDIDPNFNHAGEFIYKSAFAPGIKEALKKRKYHDTLSPDIFDIKYFDQIVDNYLVGKEVVSERTDLSALCFLSMGNCY